MEENDKTLQKQIETSEEAYQIEDMLRPLEDPEEFALKIMNSEIEQFAGD